MSALDILRSAGIENADDLDKYLSMLLEKNKVMNLTSITDPETAAKKHIIDSLTIARELDLSNKTVLDVGTGGGLPGMALKLNDRSIDMTLLDATEKKVAFLNEVKKELKIDKLRCVCARAEEFKGKYDVVVSRAVAEMRILCELCIPFVNIGGVFCAMKSKNTETELESAENAIKTLGGEIKKIADYSSDGETRKLIIIEKILETPPKYPRQFAKIKKSPL